MNISDEGIDYKGRKYKRRDLGQANDISGKTFTYLKALFGVEDKYNSWLCQCKCGNLTIVKASHLKDGSIKSCGCYSIEQSHNRTFVDLTNKSFGELTVLEEFLKEGQKKRFWSTKSANARWQSTTRFCGNTAGSCRFWAPKSSATFCNSKLTILQKTRNINQC